jgi:hypothetical protein
MKEIFADFNNFNEDGNLDLRCKASTESLGSYGNTLMDGEEVYFSDEVELRARGVLLRGKDGSWMGRSDEWEFEF